MTTAAAETHMGGTGPSSTMMRIAAMAPHTNDGARRKLSAVNDAMPMRLPMMSQR